MSVEIYAAGDVIGPSLASVSTEQGRVAACHALGLGLKEKLDPLPVSAVYSVPEVAGVGLTEDDAKEQGIDYEVGLCSFGAIPRGAISGDTDGILKLVFHRHDRCLTRSPYPRRHRVRDHRPRAGHDSQFRDD